MAYNAEQSDIREGGGLGALLKMYVHFCYIFSAGCTQLGDSSLPHVELSHKATLTSVRTLLLRRLADKR